MDAVVDCGGTEDARAGTAGGGFVDSRTSHGLLNFFSMVMPLAPELPIDTGVRALGPGVTDLEMGFVPSPSLTNVSTALSTFPPVLLRISVFLDVSGKPMSRM